MTTRRPSEKGPRAPRVALALLRVLLPLAERDEVSADVAAEYEQRASARGEAAARGWVWWQVVRSAPALLGRGWRRGWTGFEPGASEFRTGGLMFESWIMDARYAVRRLVHRPTYALLAILTLALGVGGTTAVFALVRALLLAPLPIAQEEDVRVFWSGGDWSMAEIVHVRGAVRGFTSFSGYMQADVRVAGEQGTRVIGGMTATSELFETLGARPLLGTGFQPGDDDLSAEPYAVLSHGLWQELGGRASIIGSTVEINGIPRVVRGVMPRGFWFPDPQVRVWLAQRLNPENGSGNFTLVGRMPRGAGPGAEAAAMTSVTERLRERFTYAEGWDKTRSPALTPVREFLLGPVRPTLVATLAAMAAIFLIACANVAALMLGQTAAQTTELGVRAALGAGRRRLAQQLVAEAVVLGLVSGLAGAALTVGVFRMLLRALPLGTLAENATLDWKLFALAVLVAITAAVVISLLPVFSALRQDVRDVLARGRTAGVAGRGGRVEGGLVVAEVALALIMAVGAALLIRSVANLRAVETGIGARDAAVLDVVLPSEVTGDERKRLVREITAALEPLSGVRAVAAVQRMPLRGGGDNWGIGIVGMPDLPSSTTSFRIVTPGYFDVLGVRVLEGRDFTAADRADTERVVIINRALARKYFGDADPIGQRLHTGFDSAGERIIGIVDDMKENTLTAEAPPARYMLFDQIPYTPASASFLLRRDGGVSAVSVLESARRAIRTTAPSAGVQQTTTLASIIDEGLGPARQLMRLLSLLAALALALGTVGVYGVITHFVNRRRRDLGIRMALGLRPHEVLARVVGRGSALLAGGVVLGLVGAAAVTRVLASFFYEVGASDVRALGGAALVLIAAGLLAAFVPALRASRIDPARVLREQ
jgi:putative ABC transport system permease protein